MVIGTNMSPQLSSFQNPPPFNKSMGSTSPPSTSTYLHSPASGNASRSSKSWSPIRPISSWRWFLTLVVFSLGRTKMERSPNSQPHKKMKRASTWSNTISTWHAGMIRKKKKKNLIKLYLTRLFYNIFSSRFSSNSCLEVSLWSCRPLHLTTLQPLQLLHGSF